MISKNSIKRISSLAIKKYRTREGLFVVEGDKMVLELARSEIKVAELYVTEAFQKECLATGFSAELLNVIEKEELKKISQLKTPQNSLAVCLIPRITMLPEMLRDDLTIYLDGIRDPGNLGTILRICDWFGLSTVLCSKDTVDMFNPKTIQASMGSFARVKMFECGYAELSGLAEKSGAAIYGAFMEADSIYSKVVTGKSVLVLGNEGNGIRSELERTIQQKVSIPNFSTNLQKAESLNVSVAAAILISEFKRRG